jgi:hypothetical protein
MRITASATTVHPKCRPVAAAAAAAAVAVVVSTAEFRAEQRP